MAAAGALVALLWLPARAADPPPAELIERPAPDAPPAAAASAPELAHADA
jgi:hypothetical protein